MSRNVLIVARMAGVENCARVLAQQLQVEVQVATEREAAFSFLREREYGVIVVEESLAEGDPEWADRLWSRVGLAIPLQVNFAITGCARLGREVRAALLRSQNEQAVATRAVTAQIENELKSSVTGLLLAGELALREPSMPAALAPRVRHLVELATVIRERLRGAA
jgi:vacuolar-type H+-ATPase subunit F/Vma7